MPDKTTEAELKKQFLLRLQNGIPGIESNGGNYKAQNPDGSAAGKYQFTELWLDDGNGIDGIKSFAKKSGVFDEVNDLQDFKNQPELQDAYFNYYAENHLYPKAVEYSKNNPAKFTLDEIGAVIHFQGVGAAKNQITSGVLSDKQVKGENGAKYNNVSGYRYLEVFNNSIKKIGIGNVPKTMVADEKTQEQIVENFKKKDAAIDALNIEQGPKENLRKKLYQDIANEGNIDIVNEYIQTTNDEKASEFAEFENLKKVLNGSKVEYHDPKRKGGSRGVKRVVIGESNGADLERAFKSYPDLFKNVSHFKDGDNAGTAFISDAAGAGNFVKGIAAEAKRLYPSNYVSSSGVTINEQGLDGSLNTLGSWLPQSVKDEFNSGTVSKHFETQTSKAPSERRLISKETFKKNERIDIHEERRKNEDVKTEEEKVAEKAKEDFDNTGTDYFNQQLGLLGVKDGSIDYNDRKQELPIDAIMGLGMGLIGNQQAKDAKIPLRTEEVSEAMKVYAAEMSKRAHNGLPVEVEAAMKAELADVMQGGLMAVTNASGGNAAVVLGNVAGLQAQQTKGLVAIQAADYAAKEKAFEKYGNVMQYINEFDTRRDIANHAIEFGEAKDNQKRGRDLATAGMEKLMEGLKYQRDNGPGSANSMYESFLMKRMFGFDPKAKDDGTGKPGTKSAFDMKKSKTDALEAKMQGYSGKMQNLNPNQRAAANKFIDQVKDPSKVFEYIDYLEQNPDINPENVSMDNIDLASKEGNYGLLSTDREGLNNAKAQKERVAIGNDLSFMTPGFNNSISGDPRNTPDNSGPPPIMKQNNSGPPPPFPLQKGLMEDRDENTDPSVFPGGVNPYTVVPESATMASAGLWPDGTPIDQN